MKNYLNREEQSNHLILMSAIICVNNFLEGNCITEKEKSYLKAIKKNTQMFSESVFNRLGDSYKRSIENKARLNTLRLVSRNSPLINKTNMEDTIDTDVLKAIIEETDMACNGCTDTDCKKCSLYQIKTYLNYDGKSENNDLCPFRKEVDFDFEL